MYWLARKMRTAKGFVIACGSMIYVFFSGSFTGIVLAVVGFELHHWYAWIFLILGAIILGRSFPKVMKFYVVMILAIFAGVMAYLMLAALAVLAGGTFHGFLSGQVSTGWYFWAQIYLIIAILWLLIGVPCRARNLELDPYGKGGAQETLVGFLAAAASLMSGIFFLTLRGGGGPLSNTDIGLLVTGTIFTMFLVLPAYRSIAKTCWRRGLRGLFYPKSFIERWSKTFAEFEAALTVASEPMIAEMAARDPSFLARYKEIEAQFPGFGDRHPEIADLYRKNVLASQNQPGSPPEIPSQSTGESRRGASANTRSSSSGPRPNRNSTLPTGSGSPVIRQQPVKRRQKKPQG